MSSGGLGGAHVVLIDECPGHQYHYAAASADAGFPFTYIAPGEVAHAPLSGARLIVLDLELRVDRPERTRLLRQARSVVRKVRGQGPICIVVSGLADDVRRQFERLGVERLLRSEDVYHSTALASRLLLTPASTTSGSNRSGGTVEDPQADDSEPEGRLRLRTC